MSSDTHRDTAPDPAAVAATLARAGESVVSVSLTRLTAGASRETYRVVADNQSGAADDDRDGDRGAPGGGGAWILQREVGEPRHPDGMRVQAEVMAAAVGAGVPCPPVVAVGDVDRPTTGIGSSYLITRALPGESLARRIRRDDRFHTARSRLGPQLGRALGRLHARVDPGAIDGLETVDRLADYRERIDEMGLVSPAFELALRTLGATAPDPVEPVVVHGDFRLGNLLVDEGGLTAVLDWELAHLGDPRVDLGWLCVKAWRFGGTEPVAGIGPLDPFLDAYAASSGHRFDRAEVEWFELLGSLTWGVMCGLQADRFYTGSEPSVEMLAIGTRIAEQEHDVLRLLGRVAGTEPITAVNAVLPGTGGAEGRVRPSVTDLIGAVEAQLRTDRDDPRPRFADLVAANALAVARRELEVGVSWETERSTILADMGVESESALATAIRVGDIDHTDPALIGGVGRLVDHRVAINNPRWFDLP